MRPLLYLDTARLGQTLPAARDAQIDFVRLTAEEPSSLYFEKFLRDGFEAWPDAYQSRFPGMSTWAGVAGLKASIRRLAQAPADWNVLLSSRTMPLVKVGASCLFRVCRKVLTTDLSWRPYQSVVERQATKTFNHCVVVPVRSELLRSGWTASCLANFVADQFVEQKCDGLFLPAIDHLGIRVPVRQVVERIRQRAKLRFVMVDAAQAFCHVPLNETVGVADFVVCGSHKWMGAYLPMGIALFGQARTRDVIEHRVTLSGSTGKLTDPLLEFTQQLDGGEVNSHSETANISPLLACAGAVADNEIQWPATNLVGESVRQQVSNVAGLSAWTPLGPDNSLQSNIVLMEPESRSSSWLNADTTRRKWLDAGIIATAYDGGLVRLSPAHRAGEIVSI